MDLSFILYDRQQHEHKHSQSMLLDEDEDLCSHRSTNETAGTRAGRNKKHESSTTASIYSLRYFEGEEEAGILYDRAARAHHTPWREGAVEIPCGGRKRA
jgi:hypothetical protein